QRAVYARAADARDRADVGPARPACRVDTRAARYRGRKPRAEAEARRGDPPVRRRSRLALRAARTRARARSALRRALARGLSRQGRVGKTNLREAGAKLTVRWCAADGDVGADG